MSGTVIDHVHGTRGRLVSADLDADGNHVVLVMWRPGKVVRLRQADLDAGRYGFISDNQEAS